MTDALPLVLVPGLASSARIYGPIIPQLWRQRAVMVANHVRDDNMAAIARRILDAAPARFALAGHSMGGYIAMHLAVHHAAKVKSLTLVSTTCGGPEATPVPESTLKLWIELAVLPPVESARA